MRQLLSGRTVKQMNIFRLLLLYLKMWWPTILRLLHILKHWLLHTIVLMTKLILTLLIASSLLTESQRLERILFLNCWFMIRLVRVLTLDLAQHKMKSKDIQSSQKTMSRIEFPNGKRRVSLRPSMSIGLE